MEQAEEQGLVTRKRAMPEGAVEPEKTDYSVPARRLEWPERFKESLPILVDPYLRAATLSTQATSWEHITEKYTDELINYGMNVFPISRPSSDVTDKMEAGHCTSTFQLSFLVCNLGNLARPMQFGDKTNE